jgi:hypothetical protein
MHLSENDTLFHIHNLQWPFLNYCFYKLWIEEQCFLVPAITDNKWTSSVIIKWKHWPWHLFKMCVCSRKRYNVWQKVEFCEMENDFFGNYRTRSSWVTQKEKKLTGIHLFFCLPKSLTSIRQTLLIRKKHENRQTHRNKGTGRQKDWERESYS